MIHQNKRKIKLVWLVNKILPQIAKARGENADVIGGWTVQLADILSNREDIELSVFYPQHDKKENIYGKAGRINYIGFYEEAIPELKYNPGMTDKMSEALSEIKPDLVHIWGSEFVHCLSMVKAFNNPDKSVISIQGLIHYWGLKYEGSLPQTIIKRHTFRDMLRHDSIYEQKQKFLARGKCEIDAIKLVKNVIGRTDWDKQKAFEINPELNYYHCGEILRKEFYDEKRRWNYDNCDKHSIFMSQSYYPIKGIHFALESLKELKKKYNDVKLYVSGENMFSGNLKDKLKQSSYSKYVCDRIEKYGLKENVIFVGSQKAAGMIEQYLKCNVFLQASVMENSPNSLGEAMMLGVPCVASDVGGTSSMIADTTEGYLYNHTDVNRLTEIITEVFERKSDFGEVLTKAQMHAAESYNVEKNLNSYMEVYKDLVNK